jgi:hypothetical protein
MRKERALREEDCRAGSRWRRHPAASKPTTRSAQWEQPLTILGYIYRFISNFAFLAVVYFSLNFLTSYQQRTLVAFLVLVYTAMHVVSTLRQFNFFQKIERLEADARAMAAAASPDGQVRKPIIREVGKLRHEGELKSYIDLLFLGLVALLCVSKIVTS